MSREIKFRALGRDGSWRYGIYPFVSPEMSNTIYPIDRFWEVLITLRLRRGTVGQYTGLKDKNGKEIYEGDIVNITAPFIKHNPSHVGQVIYKPAKFLWATTNGGDTYIPDAFEDNEVEVIGNIYENPELLK